MVQLPMEIIMRIRKDATDLSNALSKTKDHSIYTIGSVILRPDEDIIL